MENYQTIPIGVRRLSDGALIPNDPRNADWQDFLLWQKQGNKVLPEAPPEPTPIDPVAAFLVQIGAATGVVVPDSIQVEAGVLQPAPVEITPTPISEAPVVAKLR